MSWHSCSSPAGSRASNAKAMEKVASPGLLRSGERWACLATFFFALGLVDHAAGYAWNLLP